MPWRILVPKFYPARLWCNQYKMEPRYGCTCILGFPDDSNGKESACSAGDLGSISKSGKPSGGGNGTQLEYSCLESSMDRRARQTPVHGVAESDMTEQLAWIDWKLLEHFPGGASGKEPSCQGRRHKRCGFSPWVGKIPWRRAWQHIPVFLPREPHGQGSLAGYSPEGGTESNKTEATQLACTHASESLNWI